MKALSICQPWAWLILHAGKDVENRTWRTSHRGVVLIHAPKYTNLGHAGWPCQPELRHWVHGIAPNVVVPPVEEMPMGGIVGWFHLTDCVNLHPSPWAFRWCRWKWVIGQAHSLPFTPCRGRPGLFDIDDEAGLHMCLGMYDRYINELNERK